MHFKKCADKLGLSDVRSLQQLCSFAVTTTTTAVGPSRQN